MTESVNGFLVVDKPANLTSHDVVAKVRRGTGIKKIGHTGTLDPMATGVLVLCLGYATRLSEYVMASTKVYRATVKFGVETDTYDADGHVTAEADASHITQDVITASLPQFRGAILQIPPMYSAIQKNGKRLYDLARAGIEVEREPRPVTIYQLELLRWVWPQAEIEIKCSAGTYIRSLAHDLGAVLGVGAHLTSLRRTASGTLSDPIDWQTIQKAMKEETWAKLIIDEHIPLRHLTAIQLDAIQAALFMRGQAIPAGQIGKPPTYLNNSTPVEADHANPDHAAEVRVYDHRDRLIGIGLLSPQKLQPAKVFG
jgi:tRNA pseudouridine55 synthase